jgi:hypothetical protein
MDFSLFLNPFEPESYSNGQLGQRVVFNAGSTGEIARNSICIVHVKEYRNHVSPDHLIVNFRQELYKLFVPVNWNLNYYDLGDILPGEKIEDTYFALQTLTAELIKKNCIPVIIGGSMDLLYAISIGYEATEQLINLCAIDERINLGKPDEPLKSNAYLSSLLLRRPCFLFNHATLGIQPNINPPDELVLYEKLFFDLIKLGALSHDFRIAEPHLRNADIVGMNLDALKTSERQISVGNPNGFTLEQFCRMAKYAGISDKLNGFGIFNPSPSDSNDPAIIAHTLWYFFEGLEDRKGDFPVGSKKDYFRFSVVMEHETKELVFYKSNKTERWWMEVPYPPAESTKFERHHLVPCDKVDYENAMKDEIPDLWWRTYQKLG